MSAATASPIAVEKSRQTQLTLGVIAQHWVGQWALGKLHYDPNRVVSRWVTSSDRDAMRFRLIYNAARKDRGQAKVT